VKIILKSFGLRGGVTQQEHNKVVVLPQPRNKWKRISDLPFVYRFYSENKLYTCKGILLSGLIQFQFLFYLLLV